MSVNSKNLQDLSFEGHEWLSTEEFVTPETLEANDSLVVIKGRSHRTEVQHVQGRGRVTTKFRRTK